MIIKRAIVAAAPPSRSLCAPARSAAPAPSWISVPGGPRASSTPALVLRASICQDIGEIMATSARSGITNLTSPTSSG